MLHWGHIFLQSCCVVFGKGGSSDFQASMLDELLPPVSFPQPQTLISTDFSSICSFSVHLWVLLFSQGPTVRSCLPSLVWVDQEGVGFQPPLAPKHLVTSTCPGDRTTFCTSHAQPRRAVWDWARLGLVHPACREAEERSTVGGGVILFHLHGALGRWGCLHPPSDSKTGPWAPVSLGRWSLHCSHPAPHLCVGQSPKLCPGAVRVLVAITSPFCPLSLPTPMLCVWCRHRQSILCISLVLWCTVKDQRKLYKNTFLHPIPSHTYSQCLQNCAASERFSYCKPICSSCFLAPREVLCSIPSLLPLGWLSQSAALRAIPNSIYFFIFVTNVFILLGDVIIFSVFTLAFCPLPPEFAHGKELNSWVSWEKKKKS